MTMSSQRDYSETVAAEIDAEIRAIIDKAYSTTESILKEHMDKLVFIAEYLITHEIMDEEQFIYVMENDEPTNEALEAIADSKHKQSEAENEEQKEKKLREEQEKRAKAEAANADGSSDTTAQKFTVKKKVDAEDNSEGANAKIESDGNQDNDE